MQPQYTTAQPVMAQPAMAQPVMAQAVAAQPVYAQQQPVYAQQVQTRRWIEETGGGERELTKGDKLMD